MNNDFIRAKSDSNKMIRMQHIMDVTDRLFHEKTYHNITLSTISKEVGLARGGLYKYVSSKEEIFLQIYLQKQNKVLDEIYNQLKDKNITKKLLAKTIVNAFFNHFEYIKYHSILNAIIETNVTIEKLAEFKKNSYLQRKEIFSIISEICQCNEDKAYDIYLSIVYHSVYLYDRVSYHDSYVKAMNLAGLKIIEIDFTNSLYQFINMCLNHY